MTYSDTVEADKIRLPGTFSYQIDRDKKEEM